MSRLLPWAGVCLLLSFSSASAQLPRRVKDCLPYPTFADEVADRDNAKQPEVLPPRIRIRKVVWRGAGVPEPVREEIVTGLKQVELYVQPEWQNELGEWMRVELQKHGYYKAELGSSARLRRQSNSVTDAVVTLRVNSGPQYRLGTIGFSETTVFPFAQLLSAFPLQPGDIFDTEKIRRGLEELRRLYGSKGYINFTPVPDTTIDEAKREISLNIDIVHGRQYRVSQIRILGLDPVITEKLLQNLKLKPGDVYDGRAMESFFQENKSLLPVDANPGEDSWIERNDQEATVAILMNFVGCPTPSAEP